MSIKHNFAGYDVKNYASSSFTESIGWSCTCGKTGRVTDGRVAPTVKRARAGWLRHQHTAITNELRANLEAALKEA